MTTDYEMDALRPSEDPYHLSKDTRVFIMADPTSNTDLFKLPYCQASYKRKGYENISVQYSKTATQIGRENDLRGYDLHFDRNSVTVEQVVEWYTFMDIIRKIRVLDKHVIITKVDSVLVKDIKLSILEKPADLEFFGVGHDEHGRDVLVPTLGMLISPKYADSLMNFTPARKITGSVDAIMMNHYIRKVSSIHRYKHAYAREY